MRAFRPKGVTIYRAKAADDPRYHGIVYFCTLKSRGRSGADIRSRLMRLSDHYKREPILREWLLGRAVEI